MPNTSTQTRASRRRARNRAWARRRVRRQRARRQLIRQTPMGFGRTMSARSELITRGGSTELHMREIFPVKASTDIIDFLLPMTPSKWIGTRAAVLASTYTSCRPRQLRLSWEPALGTIAAGTAAVGTVFDGTSVNLSSRDVALTALPASNGGFSTTIWKPARSDVRLGTSLRANTFPQFNVDPDDVPLWIAVVCATEAAAGTHVGNLVVESYVSLHNPSIQPARSNSANNIEASITRSVSETESVLNVPVSNILATLVPGREYLITPKRNLVNDDGGVLTRVLGFISSQCKEILDGVAHFELPYDYSPLQSLGLSILGTSDTNF